VGFETFLTDFLEDDGEGIVGTLEDRGVGDVEFGESGFFEVLGSLESFGTTLLSKGRVLPSVIDSTSGQLVNENRAEPEIRITQ